MTEQAHGKRPSAPVHVETLYTTRCSARGDRSRIKHLARPVRLARLLQVSEKRQPEVGGGEVMKIINFFASLIALAGTGLAAPAAASVQINPVSYAMPNGSGQASGGTFNYWDVGYTGSGSTTTGGAALSGGLGKLTDGVIATQVWSEVSNAAGTGPYVGWTRRFAAGNVVVNPDPTVSFSFAGPVVIDRILVGTDNSFVGGVAAPTSILVNGVARSFTPLAAGSVGVVTLDGLNLTGDTISVQFITPFTGQTQDWVFISEVQFFGTAVPEPATWAMMIAGFGMVGATLRRRVAAVAA